MASRIAAGAVAFSDPVELEVKPLADLAVSIYLPGEVPPAFQITGRYARQTNYVSPPGNFAAETVMPVGNLTDQWFFLCGVDVLAPAEAARRGGAWRLTDRWQHLHHRRLLSLARPAGASPGRTERPAGRSDEQWARRQPHPARSSRRQRPQALRPRRAGPAGCHPRHRHARHQRPAQPLGQARGGGDGRADDRRPRADGDTGAQRRRQDHRRHADAVRQRDLYGQCVEPNPRAAPGDRQRMDPQLTAPSMEWRISTPRCATRRSRPRWRRSGIAGTGCTRATPAIAIWPTSSTWPCSIEKATGSGGRAGPPPEPFAAAVR